MVLLQVFLIRCTSCTAVYIACKRLEQIAESLVLGTEVRMHMKTFLTYTILAFTTFAINFSIYNFSFNSQATPYLYEEQRVESGLLMLKTTLPAYLVSSLLLTFLFYFASRAIVARNKARG